VAALVAAALPVYEQALHDVQCVLACSPPSHVAPPGWVACGFHDVSLSALEPTLSRCTAALGGFLDSVPMERGAFAAIPTEPQLLSICAACDEAELEAALDAERLTANSVCVHTQLPALLTSLKLTLRAFCTCVPHPRDVGTHPRQARGGCRTLAMRHTAVALLRTQDTSVHLTHLSAWVAAGCSLHLTHLDTPRSDMVTRRRFVQKPI